MEMNEKKIGVITHFFGGPSAAVLNLSASLKVGDEIHIVGATTDLVEEISSMQIEHNSVSEANPGDDVAILVSDTVRAGDEVFLRSAEPARYAPSAESDDMGLDADAGTPPVVMDPPARIIPAPAPAAPSAVAAAAKPKAKATPKKAAKKTAKKVAKKTGAKKTVAKKAAAKKAVAKKAAPKKAAAKAKPKAKTAAKSKTKSKAAPKAKTKVKAKTTPKSKAKAKVKAKATKAKAKKTVVKKKTRR